MKRIMCLVLRASLLLNLSVLIAGDAEPSILQNSPDFPLLRPFQSRVEADPRQRLSSSQQRQILSDVQQHQRRYNEPNSAENSRQFVDYKALDRQIPTSKAGLPKSNFPSLAKYRVDRAKQQQQTGKTDSRNYQEIADSQRYQPQLREQLINPPGSEKFFGNQQDVRDPGQAVFDDESAFRLEDYYDKQRQLELVKKQREQLILEQREIKRQQELLRSQQLRAQTTTANTAGPKSTLNPSTNYMTATPPTILLSSPTARRITPAESELFLKAIATHQKKFTTTTSTEPYPVTRANEAKSPTKARRERIEDSIGGQDIPKDLLSLIGSQQPQLLAASGKNKPQIKIIYQTEEPTSPGPTTAGTTTREHTGGSSTSLPASSSASTLPAADSDLLIKRLKLALAQSSDNDLKNLTTRDLILPNGRKLQVVDQALKVTTPTTTTTTIRPARAILDELTKGVLPPGADFEVLRHKDDGRLEDVGESPIHNNPGKKVTFVVLEEQPDGSYKVQGVRGNTERDNGADVDSIVERIKKGELKLPPRSNSPTVNYNSVSDKELTTIKTTKSPASYARAVGGSSTVQTTFGPTTVKYTTGNSSQKESSSSSGYSPYVTVSPHTISPADNYVTSASTTSSHVYNTLVNSASSRNPSNRYDEDRGSSRYTTAGVNQYSASSASRNNQFSASTIGQINDVTSTTSSPILSSSAFPRTTSYVHFLPNGNNNNNNNPTSTARSAVTMTQPRYNLVGSGASENLVIDDFQSTVPSFVGPNVPNSITNGGESMTNLLRREGLFAMAKYLRQSGLDSVLNETGPYTIFVPTDKAFRTLLVQLGGPEKAELKFRENPRLLSGLLLHHVIPGAFRIDSLQDEMTGVSLAGTQLRVNVYDMHDHEWNDVKITTINGAKVAPNKRDMEIPQGIAHAIDRVMFPLPVGDIVQTLRADRERRFSTFLKILHASGLEDTLAGTKTFTVFAPTDAAFENAAAQNNRPLWIDSDGGGAADAAREIVSRHVITSTLYTSGMRYYHQRETLRPGNTLNLQKSAGRVRVNEAQVVTQNVPATNGVLHAIDGVL